ncbi:MAG: class I SAM-dependent methyltransferase [Candidatus Bipolaricaulota bacterium]
MPRDLSLRNSFDSVADLYDEVRPGYPVALFEDLVALSGIQEGGRILEVGCGPGTATVELARRGYAIVAVEIGPRMAARAREKCGAFPEVRIENAPFEDWPLERESFDLVVSASAFHWVAPEVKFAKSAAALRPGGSLALFWNRSPDLPPDVRAALDAIYREEVPELADGGHEDLEAAIRRPVEEIDASDLFGEVVVRRYPWARRYSAAEYGRLLQTYSDHRALAPDALARLTSRVEAVIRERDGTIERPVLSVLYVARRCCVRSPYAS